MARRVLTLSAWGKAYWLAQQMQFESEPLRTFELLVSESNLDPQWESQLQSCRRRLSIKRLRPLPYKIFFVSCSKLLLWRAAILHGFRPMINVRIPPQSSYSENVIIFDYDLFGLFCDNACGFARTRSDDSLFLRLFWY